MRNHINQSVLLGVLLLASTLAHAQFAWIDEKGVRHYSDQPPPTNTPDAKILKLPRGMARPAPTADAAPAPEIPAAKAAPTLAEREMDYNKRQAKAAVNEKKAAADKQLADTKRTQCKNAADAKAILDSGRPTVKADGAPMSDADRARESANAASVLKDCT
jgi:hypothetical protein